MSFEENTEERKILREKLAELEHEQWMEWSKDISRKEELSIERLKRWQNLWKPYNELPEVEKEQDRVWADKVLAVHAEIEAERKQKLRQAETLWKLRPFDPMLLQKLVKTFWHTLIRHPYNGFDVYDKPQFFEAMNDAMKQAFMPIDEWAKKFAEKFEELKE